MLVSRASSKPFLHLLPISLCLNIDDQKLTCGSERCLYLLPIPILDAEKCLRFVHNFRADNQRTCLPAQNSIGSLANVCLTFTSLVSGDHKGFKEQRKSFRDPRNIMKTEIRMIRRKSKFCSSITPTR